jgi:hypothetical protein
LRAAAGQRPAAVLGGGAHRKLTVTRENNTPVHETRRERHQNKEGDTRNSPSCSKRKEGRRRRRLTARAELWLGFLVRRRAMRGRAWVSGAGWRGAWGPHFICLRGERRGRPRRWAAAHRWPPLRLGGASVGGRYGRERNGKGLDGAE